MANNRETKEELFQDKVISISRVAKVVKGGRRFSFSALVVVGDGKGQIGFGLGKANEVPDAIRKGSEQAKKRLINVSRTQGTIPFEVNGKFGSAKVVMFPAKKGKGIIAGGSVRVIVELAGIEDIVCKIHGTRNPKNVVRAVFEGLSQLQSITEYSRNRGKTESDVYQARNTSK